MRWLPICDLRFSSIVEQKACADIIHVFSIKHLLAFLAPNVIFIGQLDKDIGRRASLQLTNKYNIRCEEDQEMFNYFFQAILYQRQTYHFHPSTGLSVKVWFPSKAHLSLIPLLSLMKVFFYITCRHIAVTCSPNISIKSRANVISNKTHDLFSRWGFQ